MDSIWIDVPFQGIVGHRKNGMVWERNEKREENFYYLDFNY